MTTPRENRGPEAADEGRGTSKEKRSLLGHLRVRTQQDGGAASPALVSLEGRVTAGDGDELLKKVVDQLAGKGCTRVVLDLSVVEYMDSSGVDAVVRCYNKLADREGRLRLVVATKRIKSLFEITKLLTVIETFGTVEEALEGLEHS